MYIRLERQGTRLLLCIVESFFPHFSVYIMAVLYVLLLLLGCFLICSGQYTLDDSHGVGRMFDGIGGLSGGGVVIV